MMKKLLAIFSLLACLSCVGQKEDPDFVYPGDNTGQPGGAAEGSRFFHRVLALEFTATWCQYCPNMTAAMEKARTERPGRILDLAVHYNDEMGSSSSDIVVERYKVSAFPTAVLDLDPSTAFNRQDPGIFIDYIDRTVSVPACGIAIESSVEGGFLKVSVTVKAAEDGDYSVGAALVEDGIVADQAGAGSGYVNNSVLRAVLGSGGFDGTPAGNLKVGGEQTVQFSRAFDGSKDHHRIVAFVLKDGKALNTSTCAVGDKTGYEYEKDD